ncbi:Hypothetical protein, putative [Bodo saltans]|uniref:Uncharacterized protein n=1 Tax=Bodo saltans TaxID=75058 RepID=A0A0S4JQI7_BODSA|nr:Hypothetical protein, putative [Bodo saltans]|eukprot:CUG92472.1 Hypothetical protein, putative [Bodo saltans]
MDTISGRLLLALPRRRSLCHALVVHDVLSFAMAVRTRDALTEYIRGRCSQLPVCEDSCATNGCMADAANMDSHSPEVRQRRVSAVAASLNSPRLSSSELLVSLEYDVVLHFLRMCLTESAENNSHDTGTESSLTGVGDELLTEVCDHYANRRKFQYQWVVVDQPPVHCAGASDTLLPSPSSSPQVLATLPSAISDCIEAAFCSGRDIVCGADWTAEISSNPAMCTLHQHANKQPLWLARQCVTLRHQSRQSVSLDGAVSHHHPATPRSRISLGTSSSPQQGDDTLRRTMALQHPTSSQSVLWYLVPSWEAADASEDASVTYEPIDAALSSILERSLSEWRAGGDCGHEFSSLWGEQGTWVVHPSSTQLWELEFVEHPKANFVAPQRRRFQVLRYLKSHQDIDDISEASGAVPLHPLAELYLAMARGAAANVLVAENSSEVQMEDESTADDATIESPSTTMALFSRYDSSALQPDVMCVVAPLLLDIDTVIPLGRTTEPDPPVSAVVCALQLPFVEPSRFIWSSEAFHQEESPNTEECCTETQPRFREYAERYELFSDGVWIPLAPVNEWLLAHQHQRIFLFGAWYSYSHGVARRIPTTNNGSRTPSSRPADDDNSFLWVRLKGENPIRIVCQGVPLSLDRRLLLDSTCPEALLVEDAVIIDSVLDPREVQRTWLQGDRGYVKVLEYFALQKGSSSQQKSKFEKMREGTHQLVEDINGRPRLAGNAFTSQQPQLTHAQIAHVAEQRRVAVGALLNSSSAAKYQYKFPVLPSAL